MLRIIPILLLLSLAGCDAISTLTDGLHQAKAVESELERTTGLKPEVGFKWSNGRLLHVDVTFPRLDDSRTLRDWAATVTAAVGNHFKQKPQKIVLGFSIDPTN